MAIRGTTSLADRKMREVAVAQSATSAKLVDISRKIVHNGDSAKAVTIPTAATGSDPLEYMQ